MNKDKVGLLIIITGASGAGKDAVMKGFLNSSLIQKLNLQKVVTCTDRPPRPGEIDGKDYHFVSSQNLKKMNEESALVEPITKYGTSNKATPKSEIERLLKGENLVWRIDPSRASEIASGGFFEKKFSERPELLQKHTIILFVTAPKEVINQRRKKRDGDKYDPKEYEVRDNQDQIFLNILEKHAVSITNLDGKLDEAIESAVNSVLQFNDKIQQDYKT